MWEAFDRIERLAAAAKVLLARRVADSRVWAGHGFRSPVEFLARQAGTTTGRARGDLDASQRLCGQPVLSEACRRGVLSPAQVEAVSEAAVVDPRAESGLVARAQSLTVSELREDCARVRAAADPDPDGTHRRIHAQRSLRRFTRPDGTWCLTAQGTAEAGARLNAALDPLIEEVFRAARREGRRDSFDAYAFDALVALADTARSATDQRPGTEAQAAPRPNPTHLALLRVDVEALRRGAVEGDECCEITGVGPLPVQVARGLLGDSILKLVITRGVDVANVTHLGRGPTAAQRIALLWSAPRCTVADCHRTRVEIDHRIPWAQTRHTRLDELDPLCTHHHDLKTLHHWALVPGAGRRLLVPPDDPRHPGNGPPQPPPRTTAAPLDILCFDTS